MTGSGPGRPVSTFRPASSSANRSPTDPNGNPKASNSSSNHPAPIPRSNRPPLIRSIVAAIFARSAGWRNGADSTRLPRRARSVTAASPASAVMASSEAIGEGSTPYRENV